MPGNSLNVAAAAERQELHEEAIVGPLRRTVLEPAALAEIWRIEARPAFRRRRNRGVLVRTHALGGAWCERV